MNVTTRGLNNFYEAYLRSEQETPKDVVLVKYMVCGEVVEVTAEQFYNDLRKVSSVMMKLGMAGKHVALIGKNTYDLFLNSCAVMNVGGVAVLLSRDYDSAEIKDCVTRTHTSFLLFDHDLEERVLAADFDENVVLVDMQKSEQPNVHSMHVEREGDLVPVVNNSGLDDLCMILFTSGTTGRSKAVMLDVRAMLINSYEDFIRNEYTSMLIVLPFHHVAGCMLAFQSLRRGVTVCIGEEPKYLFQCLQAMNPEGAFTVPSLCSVMEQRLRKAKPGMSPVGNALKMVMCGGAKFQPGLLKTFEEHGIHLWQTYGATESAGRGTYCLMNEKNLGVLGKNEPIVQVKIEKGELMMSGPTFMRGYYDDPEITAETLTDGWYHTGDACMLGEDGYLYLTGRIKNLIILSNGENVSPEEIEAKLSVCLNICEVVVCEEKDRIAAHIFPQYDENADEAARAEIQDSIRSYIKQYNKEVPTFKQIAFTHFTSEPFEKTSSGKIVRTMK